MDPTMDSRNQDAGKTNSRQPLPFEFHGSAWEYFKIWLVNIGLTLVTLGIYSAWAKVRNQRYFYGNTRVDGAAFDYTASPIAILKGRLIAVGLFLIYNLATQFNPPVALALALLFIPLFPWLITRSLKFRAQNSVYRNLNFDFQGRYLQAATTFLLLPLLMVFTLGLIYPYIHYAQQRFIVANSRFGQCQFALKTPPVKFFIIYLTALIVLLSSLLLLFVLSQVLGLIPTPYLPAASLVIYPLYLYLFAYVSAETTNAVVGGMTLDEHRFRSQLKPSKLFGLYITNSLGILLSLGLLIPWAKIRSARYRAESTQMLAAEDLDHFIQQQSAAVSATGEELGDMMDIELGV